MNLETNQTTALCAWGHDIDQEERAARWCLWRVRGIGFSTMSAVLQVTQHRLAELWQMGAEDLAFQLHDVGLSRAVVDRIIRARDSDPVSTFESALDQLPPGAHLLHLTDKDYPRRLLDLVDPPAFLYVHGKTSVCAAARIIAVVGSRSVGVEGTQLAGDVACGLARGGVVVVSGGAIGVDAAAHRGAVIGGMPTIVVLPGGLGRLAPGRHRELFERVAEQGAVVSEYPFEVAARRYHFARRNRLIAALGDATVVVRAAIKGGTMLTANAARDLNRPVCAIPGALDDPLVSGCLELLVSGALTVRGPRDIMRRVYGVEGHQEVLTALLSPPEAERATHPAPAQPPTLAPDLLGPRPAQPPMSEDAAAVLDAIADHALLSGEPDSHVDVLARRLEWPVSRINTALLELELIGQVVKVAGMSAYQARKSARY